MSKLRTFKQNLSVISGLWEERDFDAALVKVEELRKTWPGNGHLHILWARLVQLQEDPKSSLEEAKQALQQAIDLDKSSAAGLIELGHFLDAVEDNPRAAAKAFSDGVSLARRQLIEGLIGQAKALLQVEKREDAFRCVFEMLHLLRFEPGAKRNGSDEPDVIVSLPSGDVFSAQLKGPFAAQIEELLGEVFARRSA